MTIASNKRVFSISRVKNEQDIIESFVRYHLRFLDGMVILDNQSSDKTLDILTQLQQEGLPVFVYPDSDVEHTQSIKTTELLYKTINEHDADIIFPLDADEFIYSENRENLIDLFEHLHSDIIYYIRLTKFCPVKTDDKEELFIPKRIVHCTPSEAYKVIISKEIALHEKIQILQGNHFIKFPSGNSHPFKEVKLRNLRLAHFPFRSFQQLVSKTAISWLNNLSRYDRNKGSTDSFHRLPLYEKIKNDPGFFNRDFYDIVREYTLRTTPNILDLDLYPIDLSFCEGMTMCYTPKEPINPIKALLENCELLALQYAETKRELKR